MRSVIWGLAVAGVALGAMGQAPAGRAGATAASPRGSASASTLPKNIDRTLQDLISLDAADTPLADFLDSLRKITQTNITANWNALTATGVGRDTPVTMHLKDVSYETAVQALIAALPASKGGGANFTVGDNILDITTNAELGKGPEPHVRNIDRALSYSLNGNASGEERNKNGKLLEQIFLAELRRAGEPMEARGHALSVKDVNLIATVSDRGLGVVDHALADFNVPVKLGQIAAGTQLTAQAKRALEAMKDPVIAAAGYEAMARDPEKFKGKISTALLAGTTEELAREKPQIDGAISDGGILWLGPRDALRSRTLMAVYDLKDLIRKMAAKNKVKPAPTPVEFESAIVQFLWQNLKPDGDGRWLALEDLLKSPSGSALISYNGLIIVFGTPATHRAVAGTMQEMAK